MDALEQNTNAQYFGATQSCIVVGSNIEHLCLLIQQQQRNRRFFIKSQSRINYACLSYIARMMGYASFMDKEEGKKIFKKAQDVIRNVEMGKKNRAANATLGADVTSAYLGIILVSIKSREIWDSQRDDTEKTMRKEARQLPVYPFIENVRGVSDLTLAIIVGEAGNLSNYPTVAKLWKRLGLAVIDGYRQGHLPAGLDKDSRNEQYQIHGYNPQRRAEIYTFLSDTMLRSQWQKGIPLGPYGAAWARKKEEYLAREWTKAHADNAARRYMSKMFIRDLWNAWRATTCVL